MTDSQDHPRITVYGATGYTGRRVCRELADRQRDFVAAGRNLEKLQQLSARLGERYGVVPTLRQATVDDAHSLDSMLAQTNVLINCAGPFTELGPPVSQAAVRNDVHYLDTTGEQRYIRWLRDELDAKATRNEVVLMPSCAYEYATGMIVGALALEQSADEIVVCYGVSNFDTTPGTKKSIIRSVAEEGYTYRDGQLAAQKSGATIYEVPCPGGEKRFGAWFPGGEPILLPRLGEVVTAESCLLVGKVWSKLIASASGVLPGLAKVAKPVVDSLVEYLDRRGDDADDNGERSPFQVVAFHPDGSEWYAALFGYDPYPTTARIIVEAASRLDERHELEYGVQSPPSLFDPREFAESVGLDLQVNEPTDR